MEHGLPAMSDHGWQSAVHRSHRRGRGEAKMAEMGLSSAGGPLPLTHAQGQAVPGTGVGGDRGTSAVQL